MSTPLGPSPARGVASEAPLPAVSIAPTGGCRGPTRRDPPCDCSSFTPAGDASTARPWMRCRPGRRSRSAPEWGETGSAAAELVILTPLLVLLITVMVAFGELQLARARLATAAQSAVQAAVLAPSTTSGTAAAQTAATSDLAGRTATCTDLATDVRYRFGGPGAGRGMVVVTVRCRASLAGIFLPGLPGSFVLTASAAGPLDPFRNPVIP
jgi:Flp pilus assembly protein TadG